MQQLFDSDLNRPLNLARQSVYVLGMRVRSLYHSVLYKLANADELGRHSFRELSYNDRLLS